MNEGGDREGACLSDHLCNVRYLRHARKIKTEEQSGEHHHHYHHHGDVDQIHRALPSTTVQSSVFLLLTGSVRSSVSLSVDTEQRCVWLGEGM